MLNCPSWPNLKWSKSSNSDVSPTNSIFTINGQQLFTQLSVKTEDNVSGNPDRNFSAENFDYNRGHIVNTSKTVWDASLVLSKFLEAQVLIHGLNLNSKHVIELGSGQGIVGLSSAVLGATATLTDVPEAIPALKNIAELNGFFCAPQEIPKDAGYIEKIVALDWLISPEDQLKDENNLEYYDFILAADVIWIDWLVKPLIHTINFLMKPGVTIGYLAYQQRGYSCHKLLFELLNLYKIRYQIIPNKQLHPQFQRGNTILIYKLFKPIN